VTTEVPSPQPLVRRFMPELDVLRGVAVLGMLFFLGFRAEYGELLFTGARGPFLLATEPGDLGVILFFVFSGFLITGIFLDSRNNPDYYRPFYTRRVLRILPAYDLLLILLALLRQVGLAYMSRKYYEEWFLQLKDRAAPQFAKAKRPAQKPADTTVKVVPAAVAAKEASESFLK
jgi:peptidoglycan/LPS O-acetylase OafA/YrhL